MKWGNHHLHFEERNALTTSSFADHNAVQTEEEVRSKESHNLQFEDRNALTTSNSKWYWLKRSSKDLCVAATELSDYFSFPKFFPFRLLRIRILLLHFENLFACPVRTSSSTFIQWCSTILRTCALQSTGTYGHEYLNASHNLRFSTRALCIIWSWAIKNFNGE